MMCSHDASTFKVLSLPAIGVVMKSHDSIEQSIKNRAQSLKEAMSLLHPLSPTMLFCLNTLLAGILEHEREVAETV